MGLFFTFWQVVLGWPPIALGMAGSTVAVGDALELR